MEPESVEAAGPRDGRTIASTVRRQHTAARRCLEGAQDDLDARARCLCAMACRTRFPVDPAGGVVRIRYPFLGNDGLAFTIAADGTVSECSYRFDGTDLDVACPADQKQE